MGGGILGSCRPAALASLGIEQRNLGNIEQHFRSLDESRAIKLFLCWPRSGGFYRFTVVFAFWYPGLFLQGTLWLSARAEMIDPWQAMGLPESGSASRLQRAHAVKFSSNRVPGEGRPQHKCYLARTLAVG
jgi:hypothetical protein